MKILVGLVIVGSTIYTCATFKVPEVTGVQLSGMDSLKGNKYYGRGVVKIKNTNSIQISSKNVSFDLFYKNRLITTGESQENFTLKSNDVTPVPVSFAVLIDSLVEYANEILKLDSVEMNSQVKGSFTAFNFQIEHKQKIKLSSKEIINGLVENSAKNSFKLTNPKVKNLKLESTELTINLELKNTFPFDLIIEKADFNVYMNENEKNKVSNWGLSNKIKLEPKKDTLINTSIIVNNLEAGVGMLEKLMSKKLDFYISGTVSIDFKGNIINIPIRQHLALNPLTGEISTIEK
jgi:LEA14-like dessication related protein